jgi:hypothetical protein
MTKLTRKDFVTSHGASSIDLNKLKQDKAAQDGLSKAGVSVDQLAKADLDKDGKISGAKEMDALFSQVDGFDHDGSAQSVMVLDPAGNPTAAGKVLAALDPTFQSKTQAVADAALDRIARFGKSYGVDQAWKSPNPNIPGNKHPDVTEFSATKGRWKCNCFAMDCLYQAGFVPATYAGNGKGDYSVAVDMHNFAKGPNRVFDSLGEVNLNALDDDKKNAAVAEILKKAQPGDLIIVRHQGDGGSDGGHCRVVVGNNFDKDGTVACAQASQDQALVRNEDVGRFTSDAVIYLLRPCRLQS